ncbi:MAG: SDR family NAD(P)-dependent oxidoreductase [Magnetococcus sp. YQC-3]
MNRKSAPGRVWAGMKLSVGFLFALPFLLLLLPVWSIYRWHERRSGRPLADLSWRALWPRRASAYSCSLPSEAMPMAAKVAVVTGGSSPLGGLICQELARLGYRVVVGYHRSAAQADALVEAIRGAGGVAQSFSFDQGEAEQIEQLLDGVERLWGVPDLLINNASLFAPTPLAEATWEGVERLLRVNLQGPFWLSICVGRRMGRQRGGQIIQLCDIWGERPLAGHAAYSVSKAGLIMATRALAREMAPAVRVNGIAPGAIIGEGRGFQRLLARTPLAGEAGPEGVLQAIRYLLTARFVTGEVLHVDGGRGLV